MEKLKYEILRKYIVPVELVSLTGQTWYDSFHNLFPWSGTTGNYIGPLNGDIIFNISGGTVPSGYYKWVESGTTWTGITKSEAYDDFILPIYLENSINDLGVMVGWDGEIEQVEQLCNFTYKYSGITSPYEIIVSNSVNPDKLRTIVNQNFTINWGDGTSSSIGSNQFSTIGHIYPTIPTGKTYDVSIYLETPWTTQKLTKPIYLPFNDTSVIENELGTMIYYPDWMTGLVQNYIRTDLDTYTGQTSGTTFVYVAIGGSKIDQKIPYGTSTPTGITIDPIEGLWTGYTIDDFYYRDYSDGYTMITGSTVDIPKEEIPNLCLTRNEHFIGFIDEPTIYSDVFVERGKQGVMEKNLRLSEIDNIGELEIYGNGYFNIIKQ